MGAESQYSLPPMNMVGMRPLAPSAPPVNFFQLGLSRPQLTAVGCGTGSARGGMGWDGMEWDGVVGEGEGRTRGGRGEGEETEATRSDHTGNTTRHRRRPPHCHARPDHKPTFSTPPQLTATLSVVTEVGAVGKVDLDPAVIVEQVGEFAVRASREQKARRTASTHR